MSAFAYFTSQLPLPLYTAQQLKQLDQMAISTLEVAGIKLMKRAGRAAVALLQQRWPEVESITVFCGAGNNGGDGYVVAALAAQKRILVNVVQLGELEQMSDDARAAYEFARQEGVIMAPFVEHGAIEGEVVVDALLGIGASGILRGDYPAAVAQINESQRPVLALDIPSGLCADTGNVADQGVKAAATISFIGMKKGQLTGRGPALCGELFFADLAVASVCENVVADAQRLDLQSLQALLPERRGDAHKGLFGHVMVVGGDLGYGGAATMAAAAAARVGAGLVSVATRAEHVAGVLARHPELMVSGVTSGQQLEPLLDRPSVLVVGPGLGRSPWSEQVLKQVCDASEARNLPLIMDADALNMLAEGRVVNGSREQWILTPHPGEAARLLNCSVAEIEQNRFSAAEELQSSYGGTVILKGAGSLVCCGNGLVGLANVGNPGMATAGMGDVLSGVLGGLVAQGMPLTDAARLGVCVHGIAGDRAAEANGQRGLMATDLIEYLQALVNPECER